MHHWQSHSEARATRRRNRNANALARDALFRGHGRSRRPRGRTCWRGVSTRREDRSILFEDDHARWEPMRPPRRGALFDRHPSAVRVGSVVLAGAAAFSTAAGLALLLWASEYPYPDITRGYTQLLGAGGIVAGAAGLVLALWMPSVRGRRSAAGWLTTAALLVGAGLGGWASAQWAIAVGLDGSGHAGDRAVVERPAAH